VPGKSAGRTDFLLPDVCIRLNSAGFSRNSLLHRTGNIDGLNSAAFSARAGKPARRNQSPSSPVDGIEAVVTDRLVTMPMEKGDAILFPDVRHDRLDYHHARPQRLGSLGEEWE